MADHWDGMTSESDHMELDLQRIRAASKEYCSVGDLKSNMKKASEIGLQLIEQNRKLAIKNQELKEELSLYKPLIEEHQQTKEQFEKYSHQVSSLLTALAKENEQLRNELSQQNPNKKENGT